MRAACSRCERLFRHSQGRITICGGGRGGKIADHGLCDSEKAEWSLTQTVLQQADESAEQQSAGGIAAAQPKINRDEQRQIQNVGLRDVHRQKRLQDQRKNHAEQNRPAVKFVDFYVRFADPQIESVVHGCFSADLLFVKRETGCPDDEGAVAALPFGGAPGFNASGSVVSNTITSSSFSMFAEGRTRICLNGEPGFTWLIVPTGKSLGKIRSMPLVTTRSPTFTSSSFPTYFMVSSGSPKPPTGL